tara:strand:+ start:494 stop:1108 length:615 start_codon:yes stop_codon:yes gene_type:complete
MGEEITKATQEMNDNIAGLTTDVTSLKTNAINVSKLALQYTGFKNELQSTLENVITYINSQNTANTKTQTEIEEKLRAYKKLLVDYKGKISLLKKGDFTTLVSELNKIETILNEQPDVEQKRKEILQKATQLLDKTNKSDPQPSPPPNNTNGQNAVSKLNPAAPGFASTPSQSKLNPAAPGFKPKKGGSRKRRKSKNSRKTRRR